MRLGISGHQDISPEIVSYVKPILTRLVNDQKDPVVGVSSLAAGADQLFGSVVLETDGSLHAIIPCDGYERTFTDAQALNQFRSLLARAETIETLPYPEPSEEAFLEAGRRVVDNSDLLIAVWDGKPAAGKGGTADVVEYAHDKNRQVRVVWPPGVSR
jgi:hypothetical protein